MVATPLVKQKKIVKRTKRFTRFESEDYPHKLKPNWRRPRGIDNRLRRQFRGNKPMVKIGYGNPQKTKHVLPNGFKKFLIKNTQDLELLLMNNRVYCGELAHNLSLITRKKIVQRAAELNIRLTNAKGKLVKAENKAK